MAVLEGAVLSSQDVVQLMFAFRLEEDVDEDRDHDEGAGQGHSSHHQPSRRGVCGDINSHFSSSAKTLWTFYSIQKT